MLLPLETLPVPLETLPGWPAAPDPGVMDVLLLLAGFPLGIGLVFLAGIMAPRWMGRDRGAQ